ncbi:MAG: NAD-dependent epimerase/dehydratase family protein [Nitrososphaerales archaeon]
MASSSLQLVIGSTGSLGNAIVNDLTSSGKPVRALVRNPAKAKKIFTHPDKVEIVEGSAEDVETLKKAFDGVSLFHNCMNVPYSQWSTLPEIHSRIIEEASKAKAKMVFPGNVYIYGHAGAEKVREDHPRNPCSKKGRIRVGLEDMFMRYSKEGKVPCVIMRFPDYYGPNSASIADGIFQSAVNNKTARWFGKLNVMHEFIFISDAAKSMIMAGERPDCFGQDFNVPGPEPILVRDWINLVFKQAGNEPRMVGTSRFFVRLAGLFNSTARSFAEMQYLTEEPLILDGGKFNNFFEADYPTRRYDDGAAQTLASLRNKNAT